jgi:hypothetical protein
VHSDPLGRLCAEQMRVIDRMLAEADFVMLQAKTLESTSRQCGGGVRTVTLPKDVGDTRGSEEYYDSAILYQGS